tara:strand:+ start:4430 stop:9115 length:4686 start_codon:yes stop_codon:yes gene_type:complete
MITTNVDKFIQDTKLKQTSVYPVVVINSNKMLENESINISTVRESIKTTSEDDSVLLNFQDYNLKISNIKESIDIKNRTIKISNLNLTLSNYEVDGSRLSDRLQALINSNVIVYYKTQSCVTLEDCLQIYVGALRKIDFDRDKVKLQLEDNTQGRFNKKVPIANLGNSDSVYNKDYINKPIPIVYGYVNKAPAILYKETTSQSEDEDVGMILYLAPDNVVNIDSPVEIKGFRAAGNPEHNNYSVMTNDNNVQGSPLFMYKDNYQNVLFDYFKYGSLTYEFMTNEQFRIDPTNNFLTINKKFYYVQPSNPPAANMLLCSKVTFPSDTRMLSGQVASEGEVTFNFTNATSTIWNPAAMIDSPMITNEYILANEDYVNTFSQIPEQNIPQDSFEEDSWITVNEFQTPYFSFYNSEALGWDTGMANHQWKIPAWCALNAEKMNRDFGMKFVSMPTADWIRSRLEDKLLESGVKESSGGEDITYDSDNSFFNIIAEDYSDEENSPKRTFANSWKTYNNFDGTIPAMQWADYIPDPSSGDFSVLAFWNFHPLGEFTDYGEPLDPMSWAAGDNNYAHLNWAKPFTHLQYKYDPVHNPQPHGHVSNSNRRILNTDGLGGECTFPSFLYRFDINPDVGNLNSSYSWLKHIYVGQKTSIVGVQDWSNIFFINIFNDGTNTPYLFNTNVFDLSSDVFPNPDNDIAIMKPTIHRGDEGDANQVRAFYQALWNGIPFGAQGTNFGSECMNSFPPMPYWSRYGGVQATADLMTGSFADIANGINAGGSTWACFFPNNVPGGTILTPDQTQGAQALENTTTTNFAEWWEYNQWNPGIRLEGLSDEPNIAIQQGTFLPLGSNADTSELWLPSPEEGIAGGAFRYDYILPESNEWLTINSRTSGSEGEVRLSLAFPLDEISDSDAIECTTFPFAKFKVYFNGDAEDVDGDGVNESGHSNFEAGVGLRFEVRMSAARLPEDEQDSLDSDDDIGIDFDEDASFLGSTMVQLMADETEAFPENTESDVSLENPMLADGETREFLWDSSAGTIYSGNYFTGGHDSTTYGGWDGSSLVISDWLMPAQFDAFVLSMRLNADADITQPAFSQIKTDIYSVGVMQYTLFENAFNGDFYIDTEGRANTTTDIVSNTYKYTGQLFEEGMDKALIENPVDIIYHFIEKELGHIDIVNEDSIAKSRQNNVDIKLGFSVTEEIESKKLLEDICTNTKLFPKFYSDGSFGFLDIKNTYQKDDSQEIQADDIISVDFSRTPVEDIYTLVNVKYKKDYAEDEHIMQTKYCDGYDFFGAGDAMVFEDLEYGVENGYSYTYYNLDREDNILEFEADYIRDKNSAMALRNFLYLNNCNQHTKIKIRLPLKYSIYEVGDVVRFDKLINGIKAYNEDYTKKVLRNGQYIYPYFMITAATKSLKHLDLELYQLHELKSTFNAAQGSVSRTTEIEGNLNMLDYNILSNYIGGARIRYTENQRQLSNPTGNGIISPLDLLYIHSIVSPSLPEFEEGEDGDFVIPDINQDGNVDVVDLVNLVNYILGESDLDDDVMLALADLNQDQIVNVIDLVNLVNYILGD